MSSDLLTTPLPLEPHKQMGEVPTPGSCPAPLKQNPVPPTPPPPGGYRPVKWRWVLSERSLAYLARYKYTSGPSTPLDQLLNHWWTYAVRFVPMWMAPNLVTLFGLMWMLASACITVAYAPTLTEPLPRRVCAFLGFSLFTYQTLDAVDGKQARRTKSSSPLGQLFDHGCDALNTVFICIMLAGTWRLGKHPWLMLDTLFNIFAAFFMGQWEEYHTGTMCTNNGVVGVTEGQLVQVGVELVSAVFGVAVWDIELFKLGPTALTLRAVLMAIGSVLTAWVTVCTITRVLAVARDPVRGGLPSDEEVGAKRLGTKHCIRQLVPVVLSFSLGVMWTVGHSSHVFMDNPVGVIVGLGITMAYLSTRMTLCHMAKQPFGDAEMVIPILLQVVTVVNTYWQVLYLPSKLPLFPLSDVVALRIYVCVILLVWARYVFGVIRDITSYLGIHCLRLKPKLK